MLNTASVGFHVIAGFPVVVVVGVAVLSFVVPLLLFLVFGFAGQGGSATAPPVQVQDAARLQPHLCSRHSHHSHHSAHFVFQLTHLCLSVCQPHYSY